MGVEVPQSDRSRSTFGSGLVNGMVSHPLKEETWVGALEMTEAAGDVGRTASNRSTMRGSNVVSSTSAMDRGTGPATGLGAWLDTVEQVGELGLDIDRRLKKGLYLWHRKKTLRMG